MSDIDLDADTGGPPVALYLVVGVLAIIGAIWVLSFVFGTVLTLLFKLLVLGLVVMAVVVAIRMVARR